MKLGQDVMIQVTRCILNTEYMCKLMHALSVLDRVKYTNLWYKSDTWVKITWAIQNNMAQMEADSW